MRLYKVLAKGRRSCNGGRTIYPAPKGGKPGAWTKKRYRVVPCISGYHLVTADRVSTWFHNGFEVWEAEGRGEHVRDVSRYFGAKHVFSQARLIRRVLSSSETGRFLAGGTKRQLRDFLYKDARKHPKK